MSALHAGQPVLNESYHRQIPAIGSAALSQLLQHRLSAAATVIISGVPSPKNSA